MFLRALITMVTADAFDRHRRERQYQAWVAAEQARLAADPRARPLFAPPVAARECDAQRPERPT
jgi:hypothetical protein